MYSVWIVLKLAARKGHTVTATIGKSSSGVRVKLANPEGLDVCAGGEGRWWFELEAAVAYLEPLADIPEAFRPALVDQEDAIVGMRRPLLRPAGPVPRAFTARDLARRFEKP